MRTKDRTEYKKQWYLKNRRRLLKVAAAYRAVNRDKTLHYSRSLSKAAQQLYRQNNISTHRASQKHWRELNKHRVRAYTKAYQKQKTATDTNFRLAKSLRRRIGTAVKNITKLGSAVKDLGCTVSELKAYLESKFKPGMNWTNYGHKGWHIDHIKPLSKFDLSDRAQFLQACHYTNLQPLWAVENISKGNKYV